MALRALAQAWASSHTLEVHERLRHSGLDEWQQLEEVGRLSHEEGYGNIDRAMRTWANRSEETRTAVESADRAIVAFAQEKFMNMGMPEDEAEGLARMIFACSVGSFAVAPSLGEGSQESIGRVLQQVLQKYLKMSG